MKQKIKIMKHKPELSDDEIRSYMDFDGLIAKKKMVEGNPVNFYWAKRVVPVVAITTIAVWFFFYQDSAPTQQPITESAQVRPDDLRDQESPVVIYDASEEDKLLQKNSETSNPVNKGQQKLKEPNKLKEIVPIEGEYIQAEPLEGYDALYTYFSSQLVYPEEALKDSVQGVQTISFLVNADGKPEDIQVKQSLGEPFEKEARRLIENMPAWKPATLKGKPVSSRVSLPLTFQIEKVKTR